MKTQKYLSKGPQGVSTTWGLHPIRDEGENHQPKQWKTHLNPLTKI